MASVVVYPRRALTGLIDAGHTKACPSVAEPHGHGLDVQFHVTNRDSFGFTGDVVVGGWVVVGGSVVTGGSVVVVVVVVVVGGGVFW